MPSFGGRGTGDLYSSLCCKMARPDLAASSLELIDQKRVDGPKLKLWFTLRFVTKRRQNVTDRLEDYIQAVTWMNDRPAAVMVIRCMGFAPFHWVFPQRG